MQNIYWVLNQHIRMISEGSRDIEKVMAAKKITFYQHRNKMHFNMY